MTGAIDEARVDTVALARAVATGTEIGEELASASFDVGEIDDRVRAACMGRSAPGGALEELQQLRARMAETDRFAETVRRDAISADGASATIDSVSPWLDPNTDSFVVGLTRQLSGRPSVAMIDRIIESLPELGSGMLDGGEFTPTRQTHLLLSDPATFFSNWQRAGDGALDASVDAALAALGAAATIMPGADNALEEIFGRRPGDELHRALLAGLHQVASDPDATASSVLGIEELQADPYRWFGSMLPDVVLEAASGAVPLSSLRTIRRLPSAAEASAPPQLLVPDRLWNAAVVGSPPPAGRPLPDLEQFRRSEGDWAPSEPVVSHRTAPFESPEGWVRDLNGSGADAPGRHNNCIDCTRAAEANWRGQDAVAAALADDNLAGVAGTRLEDWSGGRLVPADLDEVAERLQELGPGSSAMITSGWGQGQAHAYNAVNDGGVVKWVDAQIGEVSDWPPAYADAIDVSLVIWIDADGRPQ